MKNNLYEEWNPITGLPNAFHVEALHYDYEGFKVLLRGVNPQDKMFRIKFPSILCYRGLDEGDYLDFPCDKDSAISNPWSLFLVHKSDYVKWFIKTTCDVRSNDNTMHFAIYGQNECLDLLAISFPIVEWLN